MKITGKQLKTIFYILFILAVASLIGYLIYTNYIEGLFIYPDGNPVNYPFNFGTREWTTTHNMSHDIRGDVPIGYYPVGVFNQPEWPVIAVNRPLVESNPDDVNKMEKKNIPPFYNKNGYYYTEPNFYTYEYINPLLGFIPPVFNKDLSVPYAVNNQGSNSHGVKPILNTV